MNESLEDAKEELKRIDHLIYVTLKYTRTVDVLVSVIERMINAYEFAINALLELAEKQEKIEEISDIPLIKAKKVKELYDQQVIIDNIDRYLLFRKLLRSNYTKKNEYRRHVTMTGIVDDKIIEVTIDSITEMFHSLRKFMEFVERILDEND